MLQLMQLKQPKKIHSEQSNGLLRVLRVGPPQRSSDARISDSAYSSGRLPNALSDRSVGN